jgi:hypothetical protein
MHNALADLLKLARHTGRIPASVPDHYCRYVAAIHRQNTRARIAARNGA